MRLPRYLGRTVLILTTAMSASGLPAQDPPASPAYLVVVHPDVPGNAIARSLLKQIFLKEVVGWGKGLSIEAVDQSMSAPVRKDFSVDILGRTPRELLTQWQQRIRAGVRPPMVKKSDADVISFVASKRGAIGYVAAGADIDEDSGVKVLRVVTVDPG